MMENKNSFCARPLSKKGILSQLPVGSDVFKIRVLRTAESTNTQLKLEALKKPLPPWTVFVAREQKAGRGRFSRSFCSPKGTGTYFSVLLRPSPETGAKLCSDPGLVTCAAAVAVCRAFESLNGNEACIKWVNDVFVRGKKTAGILAEAQMSPERKAEFLVLGIGINVFPLDMAKMKEMPVFSSGSVFEAAEAQNMHKKQSVLDCVTAAVLQNLFEIFSEDEKSFTEEYAKRSFLTGKNVMIQSSDGAASQRAVCLGVDEKCRLLVRFPGGKEEAIAFGEVSVREDE